MRIFGLTGKSGSGKSTAARLLSKKGFFIIDGDVLAREAVLSPEVISGLCSRFGEDIVSESGSLDRKLLSERAFSSKENTAALNSLTHPEIDRLFRREIEKAKKLGFEKCLIDAAALLESPSRALCEKIIVVTAPKEIRLERILARDKITEEAALQRINAQKSDEYYLESADIIIRNYPPFSLADEISEIG